MKAAVILALLLQDQVTIPKSHREAYENAAADCEKASKLLDKDPQSALKLLDAILKNEKIEKKEVRLRIEQATAQYSDWYGFYPYQYRGRARMKLAESDSKNAVTLLEEAVKDFETSKSLGLKTSDEYLKTAQKQLEKARSAATSTAKEDPEPKFRERWIKLTEERRFVSARDWIAQEGGPLGEEKQKSYAAETEARCGKYAGERMESFQLSLDAYADPARLRKASASAFDRDFALPDSKELLGQFPEMTWAEAQVRAFKRLRSLDDKSTEEETNATIEALLQQVIASKDLASASDNPWLRKAEPFAFRVLDDSLLRMAAQAAEATPEVRNAIRDRARKRRAAWEGMVSKLPKDALENLPDLAEQGRQLDGRIEAIPVDPDQIDKVDIDACLLEKSPEEALRRVESELLKLRALRLSKQASRKLLTCLIAASSLRQFMAGRSEEEIARELADYGRDLKIVGGATDEKHWGSRVEKVFAALKR